MRARRHDGSVGEPIERRRRHSGRVHHPLKDDIVRLRATILASNPHITEQVKWKAPSFCIDGDDRVTFRLPPRGGLQLVLHRGVKVRDATGFTFLDDTGLMEWAADRAIIRLADSAHVRARESLVVTLVHQWMDAHQHRACGAGSTAHFGRSHITGRKENLMGQFAVSLLMTVDGFDGNNEFEPSSEEHQVFNDSLARAEGLVCDHENYELLVPFWDEVDVTDPALPQAERQFAELFRTRRRFVVSGTLEQVDGLATLIKDDPVTHLRDLKAGSGGELMVAAGPALCATLLDHGLIDELEILVLPVILGNGARQIGNLLRKQPLTLIQARALSSGAVVLHYQIKPSAS
ncbi:MAG: dihydrofolate reductase family protein [Chloroflexota bacterium]|nr:dihydrofolate reductase family protein [Chloroflexota bacterium]